MNLEVSVVDIPLAFEEWLFLTAKSSSGQKILLGNIYRSPNSLQENYNELYELFEYCERNFKMPKIFVGDFNFRNIDWYLTQIGASARCYNLSDNEMRFINSLRKNMYIQHISKPKRQRGADTPHILDLVITSEDCINNLEYVSPLGLSDHCVIVY